MQHTLEPTTFLLLFYCSTQKERWLKIGRVHHDHQLVYQSAAPVEVGDGEPCGSKGTMDVDRLEITKMPGNDHAGIRDFSHQNGIGLLAKLKCI